MDFDVGIHIDKVRLQRGSSTVFEDMTLHLTESRIGLIGDNGAGKSSLFRLICALDAPQSGSVTMHGRDLHTQRQPGLVGMMFQNPDDQIIFPTVEEELALGLQPQGLSRRDALEKAGQFLAQRGLAPWATRAISSLSQGQRQHVCWLALLIAAPQVLLLDEPFASLDLPGQALLDADIAAASQQVLVSTHILSHVRGFERVLWLEQGRVRMDAAGAQVCAAYEADVVQRVGTHG
jgi:biotin transport system ATP-binding protein